MYRILWLMQIRKDDAFSFLRSITVYIKVPAVKNRNLFPFPNLGNKLYILLIRPSCHAFC
jgi:hypothetical protein